MTASDLANLPNTRPLTKATAPYCTECQAFHPADDRCLGAPPRFKENLLDRWDAITSPGKPRALRVGEVVHTDNPDTLDRLSRLHGEVAMKGADGVWRRGAGLKREDFKRDTPEADWDTWVAAAGFNEQDITVLVYKLTKMSRAEALSKQPDERSRKAIQAAWRKFDRNGAQRLRAAIEKLNNNNINTLPSRMSRRRP
jgi:hypothetical protein